MTNLFALCRNAGELQVKRVQIDQSVQAKIEGIFQSQAAIFLGGVSEEIEFGGDWKPDADEILVMDVPAEASVIQPAIANPLSLPTITAANFLGEGIKALFVKSTNAGQDRLLIQVFTAQQILARRFSLMLQGETFRELTEPAFTLDNFIVAILENNKLKFKSFFNARKIFQLNQFYEVASDQQIDVFCSHENLLVANVDTFKVGADEGIRKLINAVSKAGIMDQYAVPVIVANAASLGLALAIDGDKIVMPATRKEIKQLLRFLDDGIYQASLSAKRYVTNSKRPL